MPNLSLLIKGKNLSQAALSRLRQDVDKTSQSFKKLGGSAKSLRDKAEAAQQGLTGMAVAAGAVSAAVGMMVRSFVMAAVNMEKLNKGLIAVAGGSEKAKKQLAGLREVAKLPGLGLEEAIRGSINLQAVGFSAETAEKALMAFGNALATVGKGREELFGVILALTQMRAKGKVLAEEINQIAERVPQVRAVMMEAFGTGASEDIQKMGVTATQFINIIIKELGKLPPVAGGAANSIENLNDAVFQLRVGLGDVLLPAFGKLLDSASKAVEWLNNLSTSTKTVIAWTSVAVAGITALTATVAGLGLALPYAYDGIVAFGKGLMWLAANPYVLAAAAVAGLIAAIVIFAKRHKDAEKRVRDFRQALVDDELKQLTKGLIDNREKIEKLTEAFDKHRKIIKGANKWWREIHEQFAEGKLTVKEYREELDRVNKLIVRQTGHVNALRKERAKLLEAAKKEEKEVEKPGKITEQEIKLQRELEEAEINRIEDTHKRDEALAKMKAKWETEDTEKGLKQRVLAYNKRKLLEEKLISIQKTLAFELAELRKRKAEETTKETEQAEAELEAQRREQRDAELEFQDKLRTVEQERIESARLAESRLAIERLDTERAYAMVIEDDLVRQLTLAEIGYERDIELLKQRAKSEEVTIEETLELYKQIAVRKIALEQEIEKIKSANTKKDMERLRQFSDALEEVAGGMLAPWIKVWKDATDSAKKEQELLYRAQVQTERLRISVIEDDFVREAEVIKFNYKARMNAINKELAAVETSVARKAELEKQLYYLRVKYEQDFLELSVKQSEERTKTVKKIGETLAEAPFDMIGVFREQYDIAKQHDEQMEDLDKEKQRRLREIAHDAELSAAERARAVERIERESADRRLDIEEDLQKKKTEAFESYVASFLLGIAQQIEAILQKKAAEKATEWIMGLLPIAATAATAATPAGWGAALAGVAAPEIGKAIFGFDNPVHDRLARAYGKEAAGRVLAGASFDNPRNDNSAYGLGLSSATDMLDNFQHGFDQRAGTLAGGDKGEMEEVLKGIRDKLDNPPTFDLIVDGQKIHAVVQRRQDKITKRGQGY